MRISDWSSDVCSSDLCGFDGVGDDGFHLVGQALVLIPVEDDLEGFRRLVEALQHAHLGYVGEAQQAVGCGVVELGAVQQAAVKGRNDFTARPEEPRVGKEWVSTCRSGWSPDH